VAGCGFDGFTRGVGGHRFSLALAFTFGFLLRHQGFLPCRFGFACLTREGFFDGLEDFSQICLILLASLQLLIAVFDVFVELGQDLLALGFDLVEFGALAVQVCFFASAIALVAG
jgi:hypothetical protein